MKNIFFVAILAIALSAVGCSSDNGGMVELHKNQKIYFQYEYVNYAWGYQHFGWMIDDKGNVLCFKKPENWVSADSLGYVNAVDMENNIMKIDSVCLKIDASELNKKISLIQKASEGKISEPVSEMFDAGVTIFSAFTYDPETKLYKRVLLKQIGDARIENSSEESVELYEWLQDISYEIYNAKN